VKASVPGDTVSLAKGGYGRASLNGLNVAAPGVTIRPQPGAKPVFNNIEHSGSSGLHYASGIEVLIADPTQHNASYGVFAYGCHDISFEGLKVHGKTPARTRPAQGVGVFIRGCTGRMRLSACEVYDLAVGVSNMDSVGTAISNCDFHDLMTDGIDNAGASGVVIEANSFHDFFPTPDAHPDAIQFWGTPTNPQGRDAVVTGNRIWRGVGHTIDPDGSPNPTLLPMQGVFAEDQANMTITGNAMVGTLYNGISVSGTATALIEGNLVQGAADMGSRIIARGGSSDVTVRDNTISEPVVNLQQAGDAPNLRFTLGDNATIAAASADALGPVLIEAWLSSRDPGEPPAPPEPDPRDAQIAELTARATQAEATLADVEARIAAAKAALDA
jgi:hypothetical protein